MKFSTILLPIALLQASASVHALTVSYDTAYDDANRSLTTVACSDGSHGLLTPPHTFTTFGSLPHFPYIGGAPAITGWNSPNCGTCWQLTYVNGQGVSKSINVLAIDVASPNFNIALGAMNDLTGGQAVQLGRVAITATQVASSVCGL